MKKFAAVVAVAVLFAFAAPVFAATNPFMDVPMNHWAYDAIGQLAAHGILSGYPDGTYKGKQPTPCWWACPPSCCRSGWRCEEA